MTGMTGVIKLLLYFLAVPMVIGEILGAVGRDRKPWIVRYSSGYLVYCFILGNVFSQRQKAGEQNRTDTSLDIVRQDHRHNGFGDMVGASDK